MSDRARETREALDSSLATLDQGATSRTAEIRETFKISNPMALPRLDSRGRD